MEARPCSFAAMDRRALAPFSADCTIERPVAEKKPRLAPGPKAFIVSRQPQSSPAQRTESMGEIHEPEADGAAAREKFLATFRQIRTTSADHFHDKMADSLSRK